LYIWCLVGICVALGHVSTIQATAAPHNVHATTTTPTPKPDHEVIQDLLHELHYMKQSVSELTRQVMLQQTFVEERIRSDGSSGLKQIRNNNNGDHTYQTDAESGGGVANIHEHSSNIRTIGMGELNVVMNGVEFRTRHNDYRLAMPASHPGYNAQVDIPFPEVPPAVLSKATVPEQVEEMKLWFKAFNAQDHSVRDYRPYFRAVLCYMEGGWTTNTQKLEEPFFSDRHFIDASSWFDLQDKVRFASYSGGKSNLENFAYLPTTIMNVVNGTPEYAQWNYRIICHPLKNDLPKAALEIIDDLSPRMRRNLPMSRFSESRLARYRLRREVPRAVQRYVSKPYGWGILDELMYEIPGKDNYGTTVTDDALGQTVYHVKNASLPLNTAHYQRLYHVIEKDAMGNRVVHRGFSDPNLFAAQTSDHKIAGLTIQNCNHAHPPVCTFVTQRFTWAIPLEIIYMTPLLRWNPYNLTHVDINGGREVQSIIHTSTGAQRNGNLDPAHAYNGTFNKLYYRTPAELFADGRAVDHSNADTAKGVVGVLDPQGNVRKVVASGTRIILPNIEGVGQIRTRYPIMPFHSDGQQTRKELDALKDMVMNMAKYGPLFETEPTTLSLANQTYNNQPHLLKVAPTSRDPPGYHDHEINIVQSDLNELKQGQTIRAILTSVDNGHQHSVDVSMDSHGHFVMASCDGMAHCWDGHSNQLTLEY
ncbi:hypothetical protein DPMN_029955, partial [Dreissena polymorpha]